VLKVREGGRTVNVHALLATGVNAEGYKEILGLHVRGRRRLARVLP
jgi:putative transposase